MGKPTFKPEDVKAESSQNSTVTRARKRKQLLKDADEKTSKENTDSNGNLTSSDKQLRKQEKKASTSKKSKTKKSVLEVKCESLNEGIHLCANKENQMSDLSTDKFQLKKCELKKDEIDESRALVSEPELDFSSRAHEPNIRPHIVAGQNSVNLAHFLNNRSLGVHSSKKLCKSLSSPLVSMISEMPLFRVASPFDRRVTAMDWHPSNPHVLAAGSKGGDILIWNTETTKHDLFLQGVGPGGSIQALKFWPKNDHCLLTASIDGRVTLQDIHGKKSSILSDTMDCLDYWYCSVDVSPSRDVVLTGDNMGNTLLLSAEGKQVWKHRLHKTKVTHVEWSPREDWLFVTASCDQTVKFWDVRMVKGRDSALIELKHNKPVNSAYFSLTDGCRLLTTDQRNEIRVYRGPSCSLETTILHPHRFFQHITPFKAHWHPLQDLVVIGRYPDPIFQENDSRTIDLFDVPSGDLLCQLQDSSAAGLVSLNRFNSTGDRLASAMGVSVLVWTRKEEVLKKQERLLAELKEKGISAGNRSHGRGQGQSRSRSETKQTKSKTKETKTKTDVKTKLKTKQTKK